jgi:hypothetical protein
MGTQTLSTKIAFKNILAELQEPTATKIGETETERGHRNGTRAVIHAYLLLCPIKSRSYFAESNVGCGLSGLIPRKAK